MPGACPSPYRLRGDGVSIFLDCHMRNAVEAGDLVKISPTSAIASLMLVGHGTMNPATFGRLAKICARPI